MEKGRWERKKKNARVVAKSEGRRKIDEKSMRGERERERETEKDRRLSSTSSSTSSTHTTSSRRSLLLLDTSKRASQSMKPQAREKGKVENLLGNLGS